MGELLPFYKIPVPEAGCDEAGRGCLCGPVFAAAVILPENFRNSKLNDSKQMTGKCRYELREIIEREALCFSVASVDNLQIDSINILNASILAMHRALEKLKILPEHIIVDGNRFKPFNKIPHTTIIKGDGKYLSIAAASVLAKTYRDDFMQEIHKEFPMYGWDENKGYATAKHRAAIKKYGTCPHHRMSFRLTNDQLKFEF